MILQKLQKLPLLIFFGLSLLLMGCNGGTGSDGETGTLEVRLHDAPANYEAVNVQIERVEVNNTDGKGGWEEISAPQQTFDLLELVNGAYKVLGEKELPAGTYEQIRLILAESGHSVSIDGTEHTLQIPSGAQTGIKLNVNAEIQPDIPYTLLLDFDAARSVVQQGASQSGGQYLLKPVVSATNEAITGNIAGVVSPADSEAFVYAVNGNDTISSTKVADDGSFKLIGLEEGTYSLSVDPGNDAYSTKETTGVEVTVGETNDIGTIEITAAE